ncbi:MAG: OmpH family outer membrane protein [Thermoguttaceae bacterium]
MSSSRVLAVLALGVFTLNLLGAAAWAQTGPAPPSAAGSRGRAEIALIDVGYIFKNHARFKQQMAELQGDMEREDAAMKRERDQIRALQDQLNELQAGSPDYRQREQEIAQRVADLNVRITLMRKEFLKREARIYHNTYQQIQEAVEEFATRYGVAAVLKFNSEPPDLEKPDEVLRGLNQQVIWFDKSRDITQPILESLKRRMGDPQAISQTPNYRLPKRN